MSEVVSGNIDSNRRRLLSTVLPMIISVVIIGWLLAVVGVEPFLAAVRSLSPLSIGIALCLGAAATLIQAQRWRLVSRGFGIELGLAEATARCWQASFLNMVLPGGLAGDALRAVEQRELSNGSWRGSIGSVVGERLAATVMVLAAASAVLLPRDFWLGLAVSGVAIVVAAVAWPSLRRLSTSAKTGVVGLSFAGWAIFVGLFAVAALLGEISLASTAGFSPLSVVDVIGLAALTLAGMSVPLSVGGWGPREGAAAFGFVLFGYSAEQGVAVAVAYGLLALVSVLPGAGYLLVRSVSDGLRLRQRRCVVRE
jgi:uncharacterized membrane protein YbhN (UPF0104 family)